LKYKELKTWFQVCRGGADKMEVDSTLLSKDWVLETKPQGTLVSIYKINIKNLMLEMSIGVHLHEKEQKQRVIVNLEMELEYPKAGFSDAMYRKVACYETLIKEIKTIISRGHITLVETFAEKIADLTLLDKRVLNVSVSVEKIDIFDDCEGVGATITKSRLHA
jgi:dihydroneopterin aldolase